MSRHVLVIPYLIPSTSIRIDATFMDVFDQNLLMDGKSGPKRISGHHRRVKENLMEKLATAKALNAISAINNYL